MRYLRTPVPCLKPVPRRLEIFSCPAYSPKETMKASKYLKYLSQAHEVIPVFNSYEEEATWWDETDTGAPEIEADQSEGAVSPER
jgi:hypothetical protein